MVKAGRAELKSFHDGPWQTRVCHAKPHGQATDLAKKPPECLEYIVVHELAHLLEPSHGPRFVAVMNLFMPRWQHDRDELNHLPVRHEDWDY